MRIMVDCDLVLAASDIAWMHWLERVTCSPNLVPEDGPINYDLTTYYKERLDFVGRDGYDFWRSTTIYDYVDPVMGSVEAMDRLCSKHDVVVVSQIKGNHNKSKVQFLKRHFPKIKGYVATKEKECTGDYDVIIDDRLTYLNKINSSEKILFKTPYTQDEGEECRDDTVIIDGWASVEDYLWL